jgi:hypothetical protein
MKYKNIAVIQEGLSEHHYETVIRLEEEREMMREYDKYEKRLYKKKLELKKNTIHDYLAQNPHDICNKCFSKSCNLLDETFGCRYIGKKLELDYEKEEISYNIIDIPKGVWDEIFVPLTDQQINNFTTIF